MSIFRKLMTVQSAAGFDPTTPIGTAIEGGFFAGIIVQGGAEYAIILAPKATGQSTVSRFKTTNTASPSATQTLNNGAAATAAMVAAGSHPAADFCNGLSIGGFSDWYLPARDELEICYRNFKPVTDLNIANSRFKSSITYPEGDDESGDFNGRNRNSSPLGAAYTTTNPPRTPLTAFISGGGEDFDNTIYYSATEGASNTGWSQQFGGGKQDPSEKAEIRFVRAVRRVEI